MEVYLGSWSSKRDVWYNVNDGGDRPSWEEFERYRIVVADYEIDGYEGSCYVLYWDSGQLMESSSSHCSCNGLGWYPEETDAPSIMYRLANATRGRFAKADRANDEFRAAVFKGCNPVPFEELVRHDDE
jgi:hypothetical protein